MVMMMMMIGIRRTSQRSSAQTLTDDGEDHSELVDDELRATPMVLIVPHVAALELAPLHLLHVETPYHCHLAYVGIVMLG
jgi:lauroyl/myristoyl acyltransferase